MTPDQVRLVQESFAKVTPIADQAASMFCERLFEIAPQVRAMFPPDMAEQQRKLMATLTIVVNGLRGRRGTAVDAGAGPRQGMERGGCRRVDGSVRDVSGFMINQAWGRPQAAE